MSALQGIRVLDLSRVLAGPTATQILGDLGADVIKVEKPAIAGQSGGDDTRGWGPPFLKDDQGRDTTESAYYLSANRNKRSIALDLANDKDREKIHTLLKDSDVLVENFKVGSLEKLGFGYEQLKARYPRLIYCSITGFGQDGPLAHEPGYDFMVQALSGFMATTGPVEGPPTKAGVAIVDYVTGLNATIAILAALRARDATGQGQRIDMALLDSAITMMGNLAQYALTSGTNPPRVGNAHTTIMPYNAFEASDGWIILAVGNDGQFKKFAARAGHPEWAEDERFSTNTNRVLHRDTLTPLIAAAIKTKTVSTWSADLPEHGVPCGPIHTMLDALALDQVKARNMIIEMQHPLAATPIKTVGSPLKLSATPVTYRHAPPILGQHQDEILKG